MEMVYFLLNAIFYDAVLLSSVSWLTKQKVPLLRAVMTIFITQLVSLMFFMFARPLLVFVPILIVQLAFAPKRLKHFLIILAYYFTLFAFLSGVMHILRYFYNFDTLDILFYVLLMGGIYATVSIVFMLKQQFLKRQFALGELEHKVEFYLGGQKAEGIGFVDTGNELTDSRTSFPVMIVPRCKVPEILGPLERGAVKSWSIGYSAVDQQHRTLTAFKPTLVLIDDVIVHNVVIALCDAPFSKYDFLLQPELTMGI